MTWLLVAYLAGAFLALAWGVARREDTETAVLVAVWWPVLVVVAGVVYALYLGSKARAR
jgi:hypothetical protein